MQFHEYKPRMLRHVEHHKANHNGQKISAGNMLFGCLMNKEMSASLNLEHFDGLVSEHLWRMLMRPYFNVWPVAVDLCLKTKLDIRLTDLPLTWSPLLVRFPVGNEPHGIEWIMFHRQQPQADKPEIHSEDLHVLAEAERKNPSAYATMQNEDGTTKKIPFLPTLDGFGEHTDESMYGAYLLGNHSITAYYHSKDMDSYSRIARLRFGDSDMEQELLSVTSGGLFKNGITRSDFPVSDESLPGKQAAVILKTFAFLSLLSQGHDLITPVILNADEQRYVDADEELRRKMEERARKRIGVAFDVGKGLQKEYDEAARRNGGVMPHTRRRHLRCANTGPGGTIKKFVWVKECLVNAEAGKFSEIPTGFLGEESPDESDKLLQQKKYFRPNIPKRLRFKVLKRDGFACRYCGLSPNNCEGIVLHADHIVSVSDGGATNEQNLITACDCCNLGKWKDSLSQEEVAQFSEQFAFDNQHPARIKRKRRTKQQSS